MDIKKIALFLTGMIICANASAEVKTTEINIVETTDVHGNIYSYDFINRCETTGGLPRAMSFLREQRSKYGDNCLYVDNGDILQGQPCAYYYNYIDTESPHLVSEMLNFMGCVAGNMGNHDVETGHPVYDRWVKQCSHPVLGANVVDTATGLPYLRPYCVVERDGVRIAFLGMITPSIPSWLAEPLWKGLRFEDMEESCRKWVQFIRKTEKPDVLVGLFHAGQGGNLLNGVVENASRLVVERVPGFDVVLFGHDHQQECCNVKSSDGQETLIANAGASAQAVASVTIKVIKDGNKVIDKEISGEIVNLKEFEPDAEFSSHFAPHYATVENYVSEVIGSIDRTIRGGDAYFGPCAFIDLIHQLQLSISGAEVSIAAPLGFDPVIAQGDIKVSDMFNLYKFENQLYTMRLTGAEIKGLLEMSYGLWTNQMRSENDHILALKRVADNRGDRLTFANASFNFDSAAGIIYTVDVTKPTGEKISIKSMADGSPFSLDKEYLVALNSYRGNGGGDLLTLGAGIPKEQLLGRIVKATDRDLRYYLINYIREQKQLKPRALNHWRFVPEKWAEKAVEHDRKLLFKRK